MSLELNKEIMKPKSPADMAMKYWKSKAKEERKKTSLKTYYLQKQLLEMMGIDSDPFGNPIIHFAIDIDKELSKPYLEKAFKSLFSGDDYELMRNLELAFNKTESAVEEYTSKTLSDLSVPEKVDAIFESIVAAENIAKTSSDPDEQAAAVDNVKNMTFAASSLLITGDESLRNSARESSKKHFGSESYFEEKLAVGMNSDYLKARLNKAFSLIESSQFKPDIDEEIEIKEKNSAKSKRSLKLKM
jgi:hypothetical protein